MANAAQRAEQRRRWREDGYQRVELWLPEKDINRLESMKVELGCESRAELIARIIGTHKPSGTHHSPDQLELRI